MSSPISERQLPWAHAALRIAAGLAYWSHGAQKMLGWFGGFGPDHGTAELMTRFGAAGVIELVAGVFLVLGLHTPWAAVIASGEMAVAYFWIHVGGSHQLWWWQNRGELAMVYSFVWLVFAVKGAGPFSVDAWLQRRRDAA